MKTKTIIFFLLAFLAIGYIFTQREENISTKLINYINHHNHNKDSSFYCRLSNIFDFPWDTMYIFNSDHDCWEIEKIIGKKYSCEDIDPKFYRYIFVKNNSIVYENDYSYSTSNNKIGIGINCPIHERSYPVEKGVYTAKLFYFTKENDSILVIKTEPDEYKNRGSYYELISFKD